MWFLSEDRKTLINSEMVARFCTVHDKHNTVDGKWWVVANLPNTVVTLKSGMTEEGAEEYLRGVWIDLDNYPR